MAISVVQTLQFSGTSGNFTSNVTAGNCIVVVVNDAGTSTVPSVTAVTIGGVADNFSQLVSESLSGVVDKFVTAIWADPNAAGGSKAIAITETNGHAPTVIAYEISGMVSSSLLDKNSVNNGTTSSWTSNSTATTANAIEIWIGGACSVATLSSPSGYTNVSQTNGSVTGEAGYQIVSSTGAATYNGTGASNQGWTAAVVTLKGSTPAVTSTGAMTLNLAMSATALGGDTTTSGAMTLNMSMSGSGGETFSSSGAMTLNLAMNGTSQEVFNATGATAMSSMHFAATGIYSNNATGAMTLNMAMSATDSEIFATSGSLGLNLALNGTGFQKIPFPTTPLNISIQILLNGTWTDITQYVYQRNPIVINRGRPNETQGFTPCSMNLTVNNRDGRFSPKNASGAYYPYLTRNVQIRVHVQDLAKNGAMYNGYRFWGEVSSWPPQWDPSQTDIYCDITAAGVLRRLQQGAKIGSALYRYYSKLTGNPVPIAYWPCEDGNGSSQFFEVEPSPAVAGTYTGSPNFASDTAFKGSDAIPGFNSSVWTLSTGVTGNPLSSGTQTYSTPGTYSWTVPPGVTGLNAVYAIGAGGGADAPDGSGGRGGPGGNSSLTGSGVTTVLAHGGQSFNGGTGSVNSVHHNGGNGGLGDDLFAGTAAGGGEYAAESSLTVTPGQVLTIIVGAGGSGMAGNAQVVPTSDTVTGGAGGGAAGGGASAGNNGGDGNQVSGDFTVGGVSGGAAVSPGGQGGAGGQGSNLPSTPCNSGASGQVPGGGGGMGGSSVFSNNFVIANGGNGAAGQVSFSYSGGSTPAVPANIVRFLLHIPSGGTTDGAVLAQFKTLGTLAKVTLVYHTGGNLEMFGYNSTPTQLFDSGSTAFTANGRPMLVEMKLTPSGSNINYSLSAYDPGGTSAIATATGSLAATIGEVTEVDVNPNGTVTDGTSVGHVAVQHYADSMTTVASAVNGYAGERAGDRFTRLCTEQGIMGVLIGNSSDTPLMGPQVDDILINLFQGIEDFDRGQLYESRDSFGLKYRTRVSLQNQTASLSLDYSAGTLADKLQPIIDDQRTRNDVVLTRANGSSSRQVLASGSMSILDPPNGVGDYSYTLTVAADTDSQLANCATWILDVGTVDEYRYPVVTLNMARTEVASLFSSIPSMDVGDYFKIINPPSFLTGSDIKQLCWGFTETLGPFAVWEIKINAVPESVYEGVSLPTW